MRVGKIALVGLMMDRRRITWTASVMLQPCLPGYFPCVILAESGDMVVVETK